MIYKLILIKNTNRTLNAPEVQTVLTLFGKNIKVRLGLHDHSDAASSNGLIILETIGREEELSDFLDKLNAIEHVEATKIEF